jgi:predicted metalloprotease with PDZ domain
MSGSQGISADSAVDFPRVFSINGGADMKTGPALILICTAVFGAAGLAAAQPPAGTMGFAVSMERPNTHYYHVVFNCSQLRGESHDFKMPSWTPGFYRIMDYARNVLNFRAEDGAGKVLAWEKTAKNTWRVHSGPASTIRVSYDVYAFTPSVADSFLDDTRGFISPAGVFMYIDGHLDHPVTISVEPYRGWSRISTGLDPVPGQAHTFTAPDFDILFDSPILVGNQEVLPFEVQGIPHVVAVDNLGSFDRQRFAGDLKRLVEASVAIIGEIPYRHYTFIAMGAPGSGGGGLEHLNSTAIMFNNFNLNNSYGYQSWLILAAHEFFHLYNVKRIRPIALGPFDYDRENYTNMLWMAEGLTRYYGELIVKRAGLLTRDEYFERARANILRYENIPGRLFQSVVESSFDTWTQFFNRGENATNSTISYYDKGGALGMLLDFKIRHETENRKSLDDVMRFLYRRYYLGEKRGYTDREFREACENAAGSPLDEIFEVYANTVRDIDYRTYFAYAGLDIDLTPRDLPGVFLGAETETQDGSLVISRVEYNSPAQQGGLSARDEILAIDGIRAAARTMGEILGTRKPGDRIRVLISRRNMVREVEVVLGGRSERSFRFGLLPNPDALQSLILKDWLRDP